MPERNRTVRVLLTNDDGPPGHDSPYIFGFARHLVEQLGWDVKVVIPSSQKSWIGKAFHIKDIVYGRYYYPRYPDGVGDSSSISRPVRAGELGEWVLLDATPATCANIALHNLYKGEIDLVISGPNLGRNSSTAFTLSSGTVGAAMSASLSGTRAIALSYGTVTRPTPTDLFQHAHSLSGQIIERLWSNWGPVGAGVDLYNVNIPMIAQLREAGGMPIAWTNMWKNSYGSLFSPHKLDGPPVRGEGPNVRAGGPDAQIDNGPNSVGTEHERPDELHAKELIFKFSPGADFRRLIEPDISTLEVGSDAWAIAQGWASVTPMCTSFDIPSLESDSIPKLLIAEEKEGDRFNGVRVLKMKL